MRRFSAAASTLLLLLAPVDAPAQAISHRGFIQARAVFYPQATPADERRVLVEATARYEPAFRVTPWLRLFAGLDVGSDSWNQTERRARFDVQSRSVPRPAVSLRRLMASFSGGGLTIDLGKQFIRWGKTDILVPTDRFAPRDFLEVTDNEFLAVSGFRVMYETSGNTFDVVCVPWFTPSRLPLLGTRWAPVPQPSGFPPIVWALEDFPGGAQIGGRWSHVNSRYEFSLSLYNGFNHLPLVLPAPRLTPRGAELIRIYPGLRMYGVDAAAPLRWFTLKGEAGYFASPDERAGEHVLYVIQAERQVSEWSLMGGYAGEIVTVRRATLDFAPDRGLTRAFIGRGSYTIDPTRSLAIEAAQRRNGAGTWVRGEYSQAAGVHWRATVAATVLAGSDKDFLGQYRRNSHLNLTLRYSF